MRDQMSADLRRGGCWGEVVEEAEGGMHDTGVGWGVPAHGVEDLGDEVAGVCAGCVHAPGAGVVGAVGGGKVSADQPGQARGEVVEGVDRGVGVVGTGGDCSHCHLCELLHGEADVLVGGAGIRDSHRGAQRCAQCGVDALVGVDEEERGAFEDVVAGVGFEHEQHIVLVSDGKKVLFLDRLIRRFMLLFGTISSFFDAVTFTLMIVVLHAGQSEFQSGWFIESIATQTLIIFVIRTRRTPFYRSRPSPALTAASLAVVGVGVWLPYSPLSGVLGFQPLPAPFFLVLVALVVVYLVVVEGAKVRFFARDARRAALSPRQPRIRGHHHRVARRASRFTSRTPSGHEAASSMTPGGEGRRHHLVGAAQTTSGGV